jgi:hypothetical protein
LYLGGKEKRRLEKLHNEGLHDFCSSSNIMSMDKAKRLRWTENVSLRYTGDTRTGFLMEMYGGHGHFDVVGVN